MGHTHFVVDQHHSVFSRFLLGRGGNQAVRKDAHSLGKSRTDDVLNYMFIVVVNRILIMYDLIVGDFATCAFQAHADLLEFNELGKVWDFDTWLTPMRSKIEEGISVIIGHTQRFYQHECMYTK